MLYPHSLQNLMSASAYFQQVSPEILERLQFHPGVVDIFKSASTLQDYSDRYWQGIEELQEEWESEDEDLGEQERITHEVYDRIKPHLPDLITAGLIECCWVGSDDLFDWLETEEIISTQIGNDSYEGYLSYLTTEQVIKMNASLERLRESNFIEAHRILYPRSDVPENNKHEEKEFWRFFDIISAYCQQSVNNGNGIVKRRLD
jgi:hypothetical protein